MGWGVNAGLTGRAGVGGSDVNAGAKEGKGDEGSRESLLGLGGSGWLRSCSGGGEALSQRGAAAGDRSHVPKER